MTLDERIPGLSDKELENLHENAVRLAQSGAILQRQHAETLLPLIGVELETRRAARSAAAKTKRQATTQKATTTRKRAVAARAPDDRIAT